MGRNSRRAALVSVLLVLLVSAAMGFSLEEYQEAGYLPRGTEIPELGDDHSRHYSNGDGTIRAVIDASASAKPNPEEGSPLVPDSMGCYCSGFSELLYIYGSLYEADKHVVPVVGAFYCGYYGDYYPDGWIWERGWVEWDVSSIPDAAQIANVICRTYCTMLNGPYSQVNLYGMTNQPSGLADAVTLYDDAGGTSLYGTLNVVQGQYSSATLSSFARTGLKTRLADDWFAIGYDGTGPPGGYTTWEVGLEHYTGAHPPRLVVDYQLSNATTVSVDVPVSYTHLTLPTN